MDDRGWLGQQGKRWQDEVLSAGGDRELGRGREGSALSTFIYLVPTPSSVTDSR